MFFSLKSGGFTTICNYLIVILVQSCKLIKIHTDHLLTVSFISFDMNYFLILKSNEMLSNDRVYYGSPSIFNFANICQTILKLLT